LFCANAWDCVGDYGFILAQGFTALGADGEMLLEPSLFFLAKVA
jgi:hypothetical protein